MTKQEAWPQHCGEDALRTGLAVDLGTTFVEVAWIDLYDRRVISHARVLNKQVFYGTNVLSRLSAALAGNIEELKQAAHESILDAIAHLKKEDVREGDIERIGLGADEIEQIELEASEVELDEPRAGEAEGKGRSGDKIADDAPTTEADEYYSSQEVLERCFRIYVAANSVMAPLFCGVVPEGLAQAPFTPCEDLRLDSGALIEAWCEARGVEVQNNTVLDNKVYNEGTYRQSCPYLRVLPPIAAFVGGDARAALNTTALSGLIDRAYHPEKGCTTYNMNPHLMVDLGTNAEITLRRGADLFVTSVPAGPTFEGMIGGRPVDWRGTDVIEHIAKALRSGAIDSTGLVVDPDAVLPLTQEDVREFQLAKAAVRAGIEAVLKHVQDHFHSWKPLEVETFTLVGAFGSQLDYEAARAVGLFPPQLPEPRGIAREYLIGRSFFPKMIDLSMLSNAALIGTVLAVLNEPSCLAGYITHVELAESEDYAEALMGSLDFTENS
jgi:uncharacterized 2Fe-2S/4Fe-4S cluster protein (DUF4445 family)